MNEEQLQAACYQWFHNTYPTLRRTLFAVPNGGKRPQEFVGGRMISREANRMKATGTIPGVSDLVWMLPEKVLFIEMKVEKGVQSPEQKDFEAKCTALGHTYIVVRSLDAFKRLIYTHAEESMERLKRNL